eukprot:CAMPEP_0198441634 /NCGR_PEP_ID=MMETSP1452-20131203/63415_1 /TAXON_ID=1181717 /ORGANISM="Synchroma pusillum, Strain CCMP3072" /LENGTH=52 /DNA_ID=CAMNT_0044162259 /DNA_START=22 /DNA_END=176 /DNA_ORIENTATION=+
MTLRNHREPAIVAVLEHKATKRRVVVATAHLHWDPRRPDVKASQALALLAAA